MKHVSTQSINKAISVIDNLDDQQLEEVFEKYALEQEVLLAYLMTAPVEYENEKLEGLLVYYFCLVSECYRQEGHKLNVIGEEDIEAHLDPFFAMLDAYFDNENEETIDSFVDQPNLTKFLAIEVSTEDEDGTDMDEETATQVFIVTLSMVSLMNKAIYEN